VSVHELLFESATVDGAAAESLRHTVCQRRVFKVLNAVYVGEYGNDEDEIEISKGYFSAVCVLRIKFSSTE
jgi:hypothetical protein